MADRIEVAQRLQIGIEAVPGVPVAANRVLQSFKASPKIMTAGKEFVPSGFYYPSIATVDQEWCEIDLSGPPTYTELLYVFGSLITRPVTSAIAGGASHVFTGALNSPDNPWTYTLETGDPTVGYSERGQGGLMVDGSITFNRRDPEFKGKLIGTRLDLDAPLTVGPAANAVQTLTLTGATGGTFDLILLGHLLTFAWNVPNATMQAALVLLADVGAGGVVVTGTPGASYVLTFAAGMGNVWVEAITVDGSALTGTTPTITVAQTVLGSGAAPSLLALQPILGSQIDVFLDTTYGAIGTTYLERDFSIEWGLTGRYTPIWPLRTSHRSYAAMAGVQPKSSMKFLLEADSVGKTAIGYMRAGQTFYMRIQCRGPVLGTATRYLLQIDAPVKIASPGPFNNQEGVRCLEYNGVLVSDGTAGFPTRVTLQNNVATP